LGQHQKTHKEKIRSSPERAEKQREGDAKADFGSERRAVELIISEKLGSGEGSLVY